MDRRGARKLTDSYFKPSVRRQIWSEATFAAQKRTHNLTRVLRRGLEATEDHCLLSAIALNLKRMTHNTN